jgi:Pentapeptide repeats (8 copies)
MTDFARSNDLRRAEFIGADLRGARFAEADLSGVVMRGVNAGDVDIDDPFLGDGAEVLEVRSGCRLTSPSAPWGTSGAEAPGRSACAGSVAGSRLLEA